MWSCLNENLLFCFFILPLSLCHFCFLVLPTPGSEHRLLYNGSVSIFSFLECSNIAGPISLSLCSRIRVGVLTIFTVLPIFPQQNTPLDDLVFIPFCLFSDCFSLCDHNAGFHHRFVCPETLGSGGSALPGPAILTVGL